MKSLFRLKKIGKRVLLVFTSLLVFFLLCELTFRTVLTSWKKAQDELVNFRYSPPERARMMGAFRDKPPRKNKAPNTCRILTIGDSLTWGDKIRSDGDVWPRVLERKLGKEFNQRPAIEVINFGVCGFSTVNEHELLERIGWELQFDCLILQYSINDPLPSGPNFVHEEGKWLFRTKNILPFQGLHFFFMENSYFYSFANHRFQQLQRNLSGRNYHILYEEDFIGWKACKAALSGISHRAKERKVKAIFVLFPNLEPGICSRQAYSLLNLHKKVAKVAKDSGFQVLDLLDTFIAQKKDLKEWWALELDAHPNEAAHALAAESIKKFLLQEKIVRGK